MQLRRFVQQSYRIHKLPQAILIGMFIFILSACSGESTPDALPTLVEVPENVPTNTAVPATEVVIVTDEPGQTEAVEPTTESEGIARANGVFDYQTDDGSLRLIIHTINTAETTPNFPEGAEGFKYLQLTGNLQNFTGEAFYVEPESLTLIDDSGNRYSPVSPDDYLAAPMIDITLEGSISIQGSIGFEIPEDAEAETLEWCPYNDCTTLMLRTPLP